jgi:hypothetical protein
MWYEVAFSLVVEIEMLVLNEAHPRSFTHAMVRTGSSGEEWSSQPMGKSSHNLISEPILLSICGSYRSTYFPHNRTFFTRDFLSGSFLSLDSLG